MRWLSNIKTGGEPPDGFVGERRVLYERYQAVLRRCAAVDFDDLLIYGRKLLQEFEG
jgi:superfamily I DNA/RNA helicase